MPKLTSNDDIKFTVKTAKSRKKLQVEKTTSRNLIREENTQPSNIDGLFTAMRITKRRKTNVILGK